MDLTGQGGNDGNGGEEGNGTLFTEARDSVLGLVGGFGTLKAGKLPGLNQWVAMDQLIEALEPARQQVVNHALFDRLSNLDNVRYFIKYHVYAVWDFMAYLKALQRKVTCVDLPWRPNGNRLTRQLINDIVLEEENDRTPDGEFASRFETYREAMSRINADTDGIDGLLDRLHNGADLTTALQHPDVPDANRSFVETWNIARDRQPHRIAAAFTFGREDLIPDMFQLHVEELYEEAEDQLELYHYYLKRHMELNEEEHSPMSLRMPVQLCGDVGRRWAEAQEAAQQELTSRHRLWSSNT